MTDLNKKFSIKTILILILWIFSILLIMFFNKYASKKLENRALELIESLSIESRININSTIEKKFTILETISDNISNEDLSNPQNITKSFDSIVEDNKLRRLAIATPDGTSYCNNGEIVDISDMDYFKASMNGKRYTSSIVSSKLDGKRTNFFSVPVFKDNKVIAILWASILTDDFYEELNIDTMSELGDIFIINSEGDVVASKAHITSNSDNFNLFEIINDESLEIIQMDFKNTDKGKVKLKFNHEDSFMYYAKLDYSDWWVMSLIPNNSIKVYSYTIMKTITLFNFVMILLISGIFIIVFKKEKMNYSKLKYIAYTDAITQGKNDIFLKNNIYKYINKKDDFAFISLEIINIKNIVTMIGLKNTEFLLKEVYSYLYNILNKEEIIVHSYFGEYKLLMKYTSVKELTQRLEKIDFSKINDNIKFIMGIYLVDKSNTSYEEMSSYVSIAKETLNNNHNNNKNMMYYNKSMHKSEINKIRLEEDIKNGIKNKEFKAWFQPKYGKDGKTLIGAEALVRWYKYGSIISPYIFVPMCEANGLIKDIDELVFEDVCKNIRRWINDNKNVVPIALNLSRSYLNKANFIYSLEKYIDKYKVPKDLIHFEITESSLAGNEEKLKDIVSLLHERGYLVSVDDFGVGYSSIKAISYVNFDILKIDKSFIDGIGEEKWENIIKYTINLANSLGMATVAEGIESEEQYRFLSDCNCDMFQGYYFNKPMDSENFSKLI